MVFRRSCVFLSICIPVTPIPCAYGQDRVPALAEIRQMERHRGELECASEILRLSLKSGHWVADVGASQPLYWCWWSFASTSIRPQVNRTSGIMTSTR